MSTRLLVLATLAAALLVAAPPAAASTGGGCAFGICAGIWVLDGARPAGPVTVYANLVIGEVGVNYPVPPPVPVPPVGTGTCVTVGSVGGSPLPGASVVQVCP